MANWPLDAEGLLREIEPALAGTARRTGTADLTERGLRDPWGTMLRFRRTDETGPESVR